MVSRVAIAPTRRSTYLRPMKPASGRVSALDGLRALAIAAVILGHTLPNLAPGGQIGVDVFFALSGYLITSLLLREYDQLGTISLRSFYARRALRLVPAFVVFLVGATLLALYWHNEYVWADVAAAATYTTDFPFAATPPRGALTGHTWSLSVEEQFYLMWALLLIGLLAWLARRWLPFAVGALTVTLLVLTAGLQAAGVHFSTLYYLPTTRLPELLIGALAAALVRTGLRRPVCLVGASVPVAVLCLGTIIVWMHHDTWSDPWSYRGGFAVVALLATVLILHAELRPRSALTRLLAFAPFTLIGRRSTPPTLWYIPALGIAKNCATGRLGVFGITVGLTAVAATISWYAVELPFLKRKRRFERVHLHGGEAAPSQRERRPTGTSHRIRRVLAGRLQIFISHDGRRIRRPWSSPLTDAHLEPANVAVAASLTPARPQRTRGLRDRDANNTKR
jgi:peptidoglycan/LPS O-acetylase OafA/YrhL